MKATLNGRLLAEGEDVVEAGGYAYFPAAAVRLDQLEKAPKTEDDLKCPHGVQFYDAVVDGRRHPRVAWCYERPRPALAAVGGRFAFWKEVDLT